MRSIDKYLGKRLKRLRRASEKTLEQVAKESGLSKSYLSLLERGERPIREKTAYRLTAVFGVPAETLVPDAASTAVILGEPKLGARLELEDFVLIDARHGEISIGDDCLFMTGATVLSRCTNLQEKNLLTGFVKIGNKVVLGPGAVVMPGVEVGDGEQLKAGEIRYKVRRMGE
jgi:transcriptional regulator with XRE-family HTH domain